MPTNPNPFKRIFILFLIVGLMMGCKDRDPNNNELAIELSSINQESDSLKNNLDSLKLELLSLTSQINSISLESDSLENEVYSLDSTFKILKSETDNLNSAIGLNSIIVEAKKSDESKPKETIVDDDPNPSSDYNGILFFSMIMFILSLATERFANFAKIWLHKKEFSFPYIYYYLKNKANFWTKLRFKTGFNTVNFGNLRDVSFFPEENKKRESRIILINFILGFGIALFMNADIFRIISEIQASTPHNAFGWGGTSVLSDISKTLDENVPLKDYLVFIFIVSLSTLIVYYLLILLLNKLLNSDRIKNKGLLSISSIFLGLAFLLALFAFYFCGVNEGSFIDELNIKAYLIESIIFGLSLIFTLVLFDIALHRINIDKKSSYVILFFVALVIPPLCFGALFFDDGYKFLIVKKFLGFQITAAFLSLGSKFWHDVLDIVYKMKNYKQKLSEDFTYKAENVADFEEFVNLPQNEIVNKVYNENVDVLLKNEGVVSVHTEVFDRFNGKKGIVVTVLKGTELALDTNFYYQLSSGKRYPVPVRVVYGSEFITNSDEDDNATEDKDKINIFTSAKVGKNIKKSFGSLGCKVFIEGKPYIITCLHNLSKDPHKFRTNSNFELKMLFENGLIYSKNDKDTNEIKMSAVKKSKYLFNAYADLAFIPLEEDLVFNKRDKINYEKYEDAFHDFDKDYIDDSYIAYHFDIKTEKFKVAQIVSYSSANIKYQFENGTEKKEMKDLIKVRSKTQFSQPGNSGSLVFLENKKILGIIVASSKNKNDDGYFETLVIDLKKTFNQTHLKLTL